MAEDPEVLRRLDMLKRDILFNPELLDLGKPDIHD